MIMMSEAMMSLSTVPVGEGGKMRGGWFSCEDMAWEEEEGWLGRKVDFGRWVQLCDGSSEGLGIGMRLQLHRLLVVFIMS
jgi:hypothetical protein